MQKIDELKEKILQRKKDMIEEAKKKASEEMQRLKKIEARERAKLRKQDTHIKVVIGSIIMAQKNTKVIKQLLDSVTRDVDKKYIESMLDTWDAEKKADKKSDKQSNADSIQESLPLDEQS